HYLGWSKSEELNKNIPTLISQVTKKTKHLKQSSVHLEEHLSFFVGRVCNAFKGSTKKRETQSFSKTASKGQIIYSSIAGVGYCYVISVTAKNEYCLARPGFDWNEKQCEFINHFGDTFYRPLP